MVTEDTRLEPAQRIFAVVAHVGEAFIFGVLLRVQPLKEELNYCLVSFRTSSCRIRNLTVKSHILRRRA